MRIRRRGARRKVECLAGVIGTARYLIANVLLDRDRFTCERRLIEEAPIYTPAIAVGQWRCPTDAL